MRLSCGTAPIEATDALYIRPILTVIHRGKLPSDNVNMLQFTVTRTAEICVFVIDYSTTSLAKRVRFIRANSVPCKFASAIKKTFLARTKYCQHTRLPVKLDER